MPPHTGGVDLVFTVELLNVNTVRNVLTSEVPRLCHALHNTASVSRTSRKKSKMAVYKNQLHAESGADMEDALAIPLHQCSVSPVGRKW